MLLTEAASTDSILPRKDHCPSSIGTRGELADFGNEGGWGWRETNRSIQGHPAGYAVIARIQTQSPFSVYNP